MPERTEQPDQQPTTPPLDGPTANEDDLDRALNDWPRAN